MMKSEKYKEIFEQGVKSPVDYKEWNNPKTDKDDLFKKQREKKGATKAGNTTADHKKSAEPCCTKTHSSSGSHSKSGPSAKSTPSTQSSTAKNTPKPKTPPTKQGIIASAGSPGKKVVGAVAGQATSVVEIGTQAITLDKSLQQSEAALVENFVWIRDRKSRDLQERAVIEATVWTIYTCDCAEGSIFYLYGSLRSLLPF